MKPAKHNHVFHFFKYRKLQFDISTIFLLLLLFYSGCTLWYTYQQNKQIVVEFSESLMTQVSNELVVYIDTLTNKMLALAQVEKNFIKQPIDISLANEDLISFLINVMQVNPNITILHMGNPDGSWLGVFHLIGDFRYSFAKHFPEDYKFVVQFVDRSGKEPKETWIYKDAQGKTITTQEVPFSEAPYDPRVRPWFIGAVKSGKPFWTPVYIFAFSNMPGITVGYPIYDDEHNLIAVSGGDIETQSLSDFISKLKIGKQGQAYIINEKGEAIAGPHIVTSEQSSSKTPTLPSIKSVNPTVYAAYQIYNKGGGRSFLFNDRGVDYLASFTPYNLGGDRQWQIALIIPAEEFLSQVIATQNKLYIITLIILVIAMSLITYLSRRIARPIVALSTEVDKIRHLDLEGEIKVKTHIREVFLMKQALSAMKSALSSFLRFIPKEIVQGLLDQGKEIELGGEKREISIFFSDIYGFTTISENNPTEEVLHQLTIYFEILSSTILENKGTIDKYLGDGVLAFWGAPVPLENHQTFACLAALKCQEKLSTQNLAWEREGKPAFKTRIGIHTGNVIVGLIGTPSRMNYTVMGDAVNVASRLEGINKTYQTKIVISEEVHTAVREQFLTRPLDIVAVKGKTQKVKIYELMAEKEKASGEQINFSARFEKAFDLFFNSEYGKAKELFYSLHQENPDDHPTSLYLQRLAENENII